MLEKSTNPHHSQLKMLTHWDRMSDYLNTGDCFPVLIELNITDKCNFKCKWCLSENYRGPGKSLHSVGVGPLLKFIRQFAEAGGKAVTFSGGGEPTQHPQFSEILKGIRTDTDLQIGLFTNGAFKKELREDIANACTWCRFSIDFLDGEKYHQYKGVSAKTPEKVLYNLAALRKHSHLRLGIGCNIGEYTDKNDVEGLLALMPQAADYLQFRPVIPRPYKKREKATISDAFNTLFDLSEEELRQKRIVMSMDKIKDYENKKLFDFKLCDAHRWLPVLQANGDLTICMYRPHDDKCIMGNIHQKSFRQIWRSKRRKEAIEYVHGLDYEKAGCQTCCKLYELNKMLDFMREPNIEHPCFL